MDFFTFDYTQLEILGRVGFAMLLGALVGIEREIAKKPAGLRTHMLVAAASALLVSMGDIVINDIDAKIAEDLIRSDPLRVIEAVITGVSFLGAGTIIRDRKGDVEGLTTAASVLLASALGICCAVSEFGLALILTIIAVVVLALVGYIEHLCGRKGRD